MNVGIDKILPKSVEKRRLIMHRHRDVLQSFLAKRIRASRAECGISQETMAEWLRVSPRSYAYLEKGTYCCSAATLMFYLLILSDEELYQLRIDFMALVERIEELGIA